MPVPLFSSSSFGGATSYVLDLSTVKGVLGCYKTTSFPLYRNRFINGYEQAMQYNYSNIDAQGYLPITNGGFVQLNMGVPGSQTYGGTVQYPAASAAVFTQSMSPTVNGDWFRTFSFTGSVSFNGNRLLNTQPGIFFKFDATVLGIVQTYYRRAVLGISRFGFIEEIPSTLPAYSVLDAKTLPTSRAKFSVAKTSGHGVNLSSAIRGTLFASQLYAQQKVVTLASGVSYLAGRLNLASPSTFGPDAYVSGQYNPSSGLSFTTCYLCPLVNAVNYVIFSGNTYANSLSQYVDSTTVFNSCLVTDPPKPPSSTIYLDSYDHLGALLGTQTVATYPWSNMGYSTAFSQRYYTLVADLANLGGLSLPSGTVQCALRAVTSRSGATIYTCYTISGAPINLTDYDLSRTVYVGNRSLYIDDNIAGLCGWDYTLDDTTLCNANCIALTCPEDGDYRPAMGVKV